MVQSILSFIAGEHLLGGAIHNFYSNNELFQDAYKAAHYLAKESPEGEVDFTEFLNKHKESLSEFPEFLLDNLSNPVSSLKGSVYLLFILNTMLVSNKIGKLHDICEVEKIHGLIKTYNKEGNHFYDDMKDVIGFLPKSEGLKFLHQVYGNLDATYKSIIGYREDKEFDLATDDSGIIYTKEDIGGVFKTGPHKVAVYIDGPVDRLHYTELPIHGEYYQLAMGCVLNDKTVMEHIASSKPEELTQAMKDSILPDPRYYKGWDKYYVPAVVVDAFCEYGYAGSLQANITNSFIPQASVLSEQNLSKYVDMAIEADNYVFLSCLMLDRGYWPGKNDVCSTNNWGKTVVNKLSEAGKTALLQQMLDFIEVPSVDCDNGSFVRDCGLVSSFLQDSLPDTSIMGGDADN